MLFLPHSPGPAYHARSSPTVSLIAILPIISHPTAYPGLPAIASEVAESINPEARPDYAIITMIMRKLFSALPLTAEQLESPDRFLASLTELPADQLQGLYLQALSSNGERKVDLGNRDELHQLVEENSLKNPYEPLSFDIDRTIDLLLQPDALKELLIRRLREVWENHLKSLLAKAQTALNQNLLVVQHHFAHPGLPAVFQAVTGRTLPESLLKKPDWIKDVIFTPTPFLGAVCVVLELDCRRELWVAYGLGIHATAPEGVPAVETLPGGLLPALEALADETRLQILAQIRDRGEGTAQQFITEMGLSQPATSRHLRLLEATNLLSVERRDGVKWYKINRARAGAVADNLKLFLLGSRE